MMLPGSMAVYKSAHQAIGFMLRYQERKRSPRTPILDPNVLHGRPSGEDHDADALTVLILFCRFNGSRRALTKLYIHRARFKEIKNRHDRRVISHANRRFLKALCCRGLLIYQGDDKEPHRFCKRLKDGRCHRFEAPEKKGLQVVQNS